MISIESKMPLWAIKEALARCGIDPGNDNLMMWRDRTYARSVELLAAMIAKYEPLVENESNEHDEFCSSWDAGECNCK